MIIQQLPRIVLATSICALGGCGGLLPVYPSMSSDQSLQLIAQRQEQLRSISVEGDLELLNPDGQTVSLECVLVAQFPDRVHVRAWKFGHTVFDLTLLDGQAWIVAPEAESSQRQVDMQRVPARRISEAFELMGPAYFLAARPVSSTASMLTVRGPGLGRDDVICEIDRETLTPRRFIVPATGESHPNELLFEQYALVDDFPWADTIVLRSTAGRIRIRCRDVEINGSIPAGAFVPFQGAIRLP